MNALRKFLALSWIERALLFEALLYLGGARLALLLVPFRRISRYLGKQVPAEALVAAARPVGSTKPLPPEAHKIAWAVGVMAHRTPWESACLAQAMAGKFMLRRRRVPNELSLGMRKDVSGKPTAHAWLQAGNTTLLGATPEPFTVLSTFVDPEW